MNPEPLYMVRMSLDPAVLARFAAQQGLAHADDDGNGYIAHAWLAAMFGRAAPKPFRLLDGHRGGPVVLLGYAAADHASLITRAKTFADPLAWSVLVSDSLVGKPMPAAWNAGHCLTLEVLACPVSRKDGSEKDVYLRAVDRSGPDAPGRAAVYAEWLQRQVQGAAELRNIRLDGFARVNLARRSAAAGGGRRLHTVERPRALFGADLTIADPVSFGGLLRRGIGRHRAFGFGMLLLRPPA